MYMLSMCYVHARKRETVCTNDSCMCVCVCMLTREEGKKTEICMCVQYFAHYSDDDEIMGRKVAKGIHYFNYE